jgi:hypothetical protein
VVVLREFEQGFRLRKRGRKGAERAGMCMCIPATRKKNQRARPEIAGSSRAKEGAHTYYLKFLIAEGNIEQP